jgi:hypothetical protein
LAVTGTGGLILTQVRRTTIRFTEEEWQALEVAFSTVPRRTSWNGWAVSLLMKAMKDIQRKEEATNAGS